MCVNNAKNRDQLRNPDRSCCRKLTPLPLRPNPEGRDGKWEGESGRGDRVGKVEEGLDLDIFPGAPDFLLVTPLPSVEWLWCLLGLRCTLRRAATTWTWFVCW